MTLRLWALKIGELKPLSRGGLLLLSARCAMRVEPWLPQGSDALWREGLECLATAAFEKPASSDAAITLARRLSDQGAIASNRLEATDQPHGTSAQEGRNQVSENVGFDCCGIGARKAHCRAVRARSRRCRVSCNLECDPCRHSSRCSYDIGTRDCEGPPRFAPQMRTALGRWDADLGVM